MKCLHATIAVLGLCLVLLSAVTLPIDDPDASYDESEAPVNLATPVAVKSVANDNLISQVRGLVVVLGKQQTTTDDRAMKRAITRKPLVHQSNSRVKILTILLC